LGENLPKGGYFDNGQAFVDDALTYTFSGCNMVITDEKHVLDSLHQGGDPNPTVYSLEFQPRSGTTWKHSMRELTSDELFGAKSGLRASMYVNFRTVNLSSVTVSTHHIDDLLGFEDDVVTGKPVRLSLDEESLANRIAKAFRHAVSLCGGSSDPF